MEENLTPLSLLDNNLSDVEKEMLAIAIVATKVPDAFPPRNRNKLPQVTSKASFDLILSLSVCKFVGSYSWLILKKRGMTDEDSTIWMKMKALNWHKPVTGDTSCQ